MSVPQTTRAAILLGLWKPKKMDEAMCQAFLGAEGTLYYKDFPNGEILVIDQTQGTVRLEIHCPDGIKAWHVDICTGKFTQTAGD